MTTNERTETMKYVREFDAAHPDGQRRTLTIYQYDSGDYWMHDSEDATHSGRVQIADDSERAVLDAIEPMGFDLVHTYRSTDGEDTLEICGDTYTCHTSGTSDPLYTGTDQAAAKVAVGGDAVWDDLMAATPEHQQ